jgi:hypothetical protein
VWSREGDEAEKGSVWILGRMVAKVLYCVIRNRSARVVGIIGRDRWKGDVILRVQLWPKVPIMIIQTVRMVEAIFGRLPIKVPFAGVVGSKTEAVE